MSDQTAEVDNKMLDQLFKQTLGDTSPPSVDEDKEPQIASTEVSTKEEAASTEVDTSKKPDEQELPEWAANLPEEALTHIKSLEAERQRLFNNWRVEQGRLAKVMQERRKADPAPKVAEAPAVKETPQESKVAKLLNELKGVDAPLAELLEGLREEVTREAERKYEDKLKQFEQTAIAPLKQNEEERYVQEQLNAMDRECSNWRDIVNDPYYKQFVSTQPAAIQQMAGSWDSKELLYVISLYDRMVFGAPVPEQKPSKPEGGDPSKLETARQDRLRASVVPANTAATRTAQPTHEESLKALFEKELNRRN